MITFADLDDLVKMAIDYNEEEFRGEGSHTEQSLYISVIKSIEARSIFLWRVEGQIVSFVQVINEHKHYALLGGLYTKPEFRGRGYAYFLLCAVTNGLLTKAGYRKCGLISDADNPFTTKIFNDVGYNPVYKWVLITKE